MADIGDNMKRVSVADRSSSRARWTIQALALLLFVIGMFGGALAAQSQIVVYDDALENGFQDFSYGGGTNFASTAQVHSGTKSISFVGNSFNAVAMSRTAQPVNTSTYPTVHFLVHGGTVGGQHVRIDLYIDGNII